MTRTPSGIAAYRRLARRNLPALLTFKFLNEYGYDKGEVVVRAIVSDICDTVRRYYRRKGDLEPGEMIYLAPAKGEGSRRGKTIADTRLVPVTLTIVAAEDIDAIRAGARAAQRREIRVRRLSREAFDQGGLLSQRDIATLTGCSEGAVSITAIDLRQRGEFLPLRGYLEDMGRFPTHKAAIVRLYLQGMLTPDIARATYHSKEAVDRYVRAFERVRLLAARYAREELPLLTGMPASLIDEYLALIDHHHALPKEVSQDAAASS